MGGHGQYGYNGPSWNAWQTGSIQWLKDIGIYEIKAHMHELLERIRPGRVVRIFPKAWNVSDIPREERMHMFDLRPRFLEANPSIVPNPIPPLPK